MGAAAVHPLLAFARVVVRERKVRGAVAQRLAQRHAFAVERVGHLSDRGLRSFLVDVPALEMLQRPGIHGDQRRMNDRARIHQRTRERVAAILDHAAKRCPQHGDRVILARERKDSGRQPLSPHRDRHLERAVLAREPRQRAGLRERGSSAVAGFMRGLGEDHRSERAGRQEHDLAVREVRRQCSGDVGLCGRRRGTEDELGPAHRLADVVGDERELGFVPAGKILDHDRAVGGAMGRDRSTITAPQPYLVTGERKVPGGRERPVAAAEDRDAHQRRFPLFSRASTMSTISPACPR